MLAELRTAFSGIKLTFDAADVLDRLHSGPSVSMDLYPMLEEEQPDGTVFAGLLISLWNRGDKPADQGYLRFAPGGWSVLTLNTPDGVDLDKTSFGYVTEFSDRSVFAEHTNRVALVGGAFDPTEEYSVEFETACREGSVQYGSYQLRVEDGSIQSDRREYQDPRGVHE